MSYGGSGYARTLTLDNENLAADPAFFSLLAFRRGDPG